MVTRAEAKQQTREALLVAGMDLFREQGLDGPSLDAICERAGKTRGAFYVHFTDREAFQVAVMERILQAYVSMIATTADPAAGLYASIEHFVDNVLDLARGGARSSVGVLGGDQLRLLLQGIHRNPQVRERFIALVGLARAQLAAVISAGQHAGTVREDVSAGALSSLLVAQVLGVMALLETGAPSVEDVEQLVGGVLTLLQPPEKFAAQEA